MKHTVFIDGSAGTTGLRIVQRLSARDDLTLLTLPEEKRKDPGARRELLCSADVAFLCLPDAAAREAAAMAQNPDTVVIDTSTAHRVSPDWVYGMAELPGQRERLRGAKRIANPGCHATGFILLAAPLVAAGLLSPDAALTCFSLTGYTGGGKSMIARYETAPRDSLLDAPRLYALGQQHKHLPEMNAFTGLRVPPVFCPVVAPFPAGMEVVIPLHRSQLAGGADDVLAVYRAAYPGPVVTCAAADEGGFLSAGALAGSDSAQVGVWGGEDRLTLVARFDNLGKGASGAAIQNMNLALGIEETRGLQAEASV